MQLLFPWLLSAKSISNSFSGPLLAAYVRLHIALRLFICTKTVDPLLQLVHSSSESWDVIVALCHGGNMFLHRSIPAVLLIYLINDGPNIDESV